MTPPRVVLALASSFLVAGCAEYPANPPATTFDRDGGYRFYNFHPTPDNSDDVFVVLAFSGGGTRAAAFSYGVLEHLRDTTITVNGHPRRLLDEVDVISSISGGSFTAAYYALNRDRTFTDFEPRFLNRNIQGALAARIFLNPLNWWRLGSPYFSRTDLAAEYYDATIFDHKTFGDLTAAGRRPYLVLNATDLTLNSRFEFTQGQFDLLHSNLAPVPVARGVAASSCFPVALAPISLHSYPDLKNGYVEPPWVKTATDEWEAQPINYDRARRVHSYFDHRRQYVHLLDGGLADNIGLRGPWESMVSENTYDNFPTPDSNDPDPGEPRGLSIHSMIVNKKIHTLVFIVVNARSGSEDLAPAHDKLNHSPGIPTVLGAVVNGPFDNYSSDTVQLFQDELKNRADLAAVVPALPQVKYLYAEVNFNGINNPDLQSKCRQAGTNFSLSEEAVNNVKAGAHEALKSSLGFADILTHLHGTYTPAP